MSMIKRFNELVGFDDEESRDRLEIPNLRGELDPGSSTMKDFYKPQNEKNTHGELKKIIFKFPILSKFHGNKKSINGFEMISLYATSAERSKDDFYCQFSFIYNGNYNIGIILREREDMSEKNWKVFEYVVNNIEEVYDIASGFLKACESLGIINKRDLSIYLSSKN